MNISEKPHNHLCGLMKTISTLSSHCNSLTSVVEACDRIMKSVMDHEECNASWSV